MSVIREETSKLAQTLLDRFSKDLTLEAVYSDLYGLNIMIQGGTGYFLFPIALIRGITDVSKAIQVLEEGEPTTVEDLVLLLDQAVMTVPSRGWTARNLELVRFLTQLFDQHPDFWLTADFSRWKPLIYSYQPRYGVTIDGDSLTREYRQIVRNYFMTNQIPQWDRWALDCLLVPPQLDDRVSVESLRHPSFPIWVSEESCTKTPLFCLHLIPTKTVTKMNPLYQALVERMESFWNLDHLQTIGSRKSYFWCLPIIDDAYESFKASEQEDRPTYLSTSTFAHKENFLPKVDIVHELKDLITAYNTKTIDEREIFQKKWVKASKEERLGSLVKQLFQARLYISKTPPYKPLIVWIPGKTKRDRTTLREINSFLTNKFFFGGLRLDYTRGTFYFTLEPEMQETKKTLCEWLETIGLISYIWEAEEFTSTPFTIYNLPASENFEHGLWSLPQRHLLLKGAEKTAIVQKTLDTEKKRLQTFQ